MDKPASSGDDGKPGHRRGRPHDAEGAREAILDAGEEIFAQHGFDGARIDLIAQASGYNKSLIFQYFGDKLGLYSAVIRRADDQTRQMQERALAEFDAMHGEMRLERIRSFVREYVGWYFDYLVEHPRILRIFNWEMAEGWQTFSKVLSERDYQDIEDFAPVFAKLQAAGLIHAEPMPLIQYTTALFSIHVYLAILPFYHLFVPQADLSSPVVLKQGREFLIDFIMNGLLVGPGKAIPKRARSGVSAPLRKKARLRG